MLADPFMHAQMEETIDGGSCAEAAVDAICTMYADMFAGVEDELMRQRATDVRDIRDRLLAILLGVTGVDLSRLPAGSVLVARDLTPSMTVGLSRENIAGIITEVGGRTSHSAILARALELPAVLSVPKALGLIEDGDGLIVDGGEGKAVLNPDESTRAEYLKRQREFLARRAALEVYRNQATVDADGNTDDLKECLRLAAEGKIRPAVMVTHVGGIDSIVDATANLPNIPGGKKLTYTQFDMPLTAIEDFREKGRTDPLFARLADSCDAHDGLWNAEAEKILFQHFGVK